MKNLQVRNVPDRMHAVLRRRAADAGMSLQEYLLGVLRDSASRPTVPEVLKRAGERTGGRLSLTEAATLVREERDRD